MAYGSSRLPSRFPVGTKFVIEGRRGGEGQVQVFSRYLEFPDGTFFPLPTLPLRRKSGASRRLRKSRSMALRTMGSSSMVKMMGLGKVQISFRCGLVN